MGPSSTMVPAIHEWSSLWQAAENGSNLSRREFIQKALGGTSLVVQWLRLCSPNAGGLSSIPGWGTRSRMHAATKRSRVGLPQWRSGWESACQCREHGFEPWSGKIPHATEQLGPWATITEPAHLEPVLRNKRGRDGERPAHRDEEWPPFAATRESPRTETKTQHSHK